MLEHACIMRNEDIIDTYALPQYMQPKSSLDASHGEKVNYDLKEMTAILEKDLILEALRKFSNKSKAIDALGISRSAFYEKIKKYGIDVDGIL